MLLIVLGNCIQRHLSTLEVYIPNLSYFCCTYRGFVSIASIHNLSLTQEIKQRYPYVLWIGGIV